MKRHADNIEFFLNSLGKLHILGVKMDVSPLYPPVPIPVPRGTPSIGHLVSWDHSQSWTVAKWEDFGSSPKVSQEIVEFTIGDNGPDDYLSGHQIQGRILFPATGYIVLAWKSLAKRLGKPFHNVAVVLEDVQFSRATIMQKHRRNGALKWEKNWVTFLDSMLQGSELTRTGRLLQLPVKIIACRIDPLLHLEMAEKAMEAGKRELYVANYDMAVKVLSDRFGRRDMLVDDHLDHLLSLEPVRSSFEVSKLTILHDEVTFRMNALDGLGVSPGEHYPRTSAYYTVKGKRRLCHRTTLRRLQPIKQSS
ncbi:hypothetical protein HPB50_025243 [Hyalomma asiaticum]|uniref:Uncharacterized protein n=1 Tax=Hyalomma asiaticum TaxID=266040 RepID=A0ACB7SPF3_HYAAI|nr:hypothetical protein HPB50_025243 [Hyalomma asiaticum]